ncbi:2-oxo-4-hydroxy-4-carboxy-5-ureidoimidazoline decarboxylase [Paenibacillus glycanilyticus]|uniref:2-oxo-4-hydroxy-4-carboxy-5-ureidoimidazoline decarboxylase n=1 Tax=Paenibacillus glycanilyticus TaxID=126569 RepID=UPI00203EE64C|nr:2-oxo-4-hydroxy-4-carboxy-5-ureidoimidazoline decarboxylase [Paenibacillus glycanilyticus]MCM3625814.1 2-oxo-4-hydroxy-4-carboxy-5-ureidoimidazoline decarboxylase [Paenibacillus glycanilyticus]
MNLNLSTINEMPKEQFVEALGAIFEHSPWVAELAFDARPFRTADELHDAMVKVVIHSSEDRKIALFREHPDLATRIKIGEYSTLEQKGAGLDRLTPEEFEVFTRRNREYTGKFGFPFILAVRGKDKSDILAAMEARIDNSLEEEADEALWQIARITKFRLHDLITE